MRQWRVGTLTMGLLLVFSGIGLLYAQFDRTGVVDNIFKWWPVVFILLGIEVLVQNYLKKDEGSVLRYDIFSIIIVFLIVVSGLGLHTVSELGLSKIIRNEINRQVFSVPVSHEVPLDPGTKQVVLETSNGNIKLDTYSGSSIRVRSNLKIRAESREEALAGVEELTLITEQKAGNTQYLCFEPTLNSGIPVPSDVSILVPDSMAVHLDLEGNAAEVNLNSVNSDWKITGPGRCSLNLPSTANVTVTALVDNKEALHGNLAWNVSPSFPIQDQAEYDHHEGRPVQAQAKLGNGTHKLNVVGINDLAINRLP